MCKPEENPDYFRDMPYGSMTYLIECKLFTHLRLPIGRKQAFVFFQSDRQWECSLGKSAAVRLEGFSHGSRWAPEPVEKELREWVERKTYKHYASVSTTGLAVKLLSRPTLIVAPCPCQLPQLCSQGLLCQSLPNTHADYSLSYISQLYRGGKGIKLLCRQPVI